MKADAHPYHIQMSVISIWTVFAPDSIRLDTHFIIEPSESVWQPASCPRGNINIVGMAMIHIGSGLHF